MSFWVRRALVLLPALGVLAACSTTPTGPSERATHASPLPDQRALVSLNPQELPPVPPRISINPPTALGATRFVAFGDSITYGTLSTFDGAFLYDVPSHSYPVRLQLALNQYHTPQSFTVVNEGEPGEWAIDGVRRIQRVITANRPQGLLLLEGVNDIGLGQSVASTANALARIVDTARQNNVTVLIATMPQTYAITTPGGEFRDNGAELVPLLNAEIRRIVSARQNVYLVDVNRAFGTDRSLMGGDGLHPTEQGLQLMATTFLAAIEAVFPVRGSFQ